MAEDFTTWTETGTHLTVTADQIVYDDLPRDDSTSHLYSDQGAGSISGDFTYQFKFTTGALAEVEQNSWVYLLYIANALDWPFDLESSGGGTEDYQGIYCTNSGGDIVLNLRIVETGSAASTDTSVALLPSTQYFLTFSRDDDAGVNSTGRLRLQITTVNYPGNSDAKGVDTLVADASSGQQNDFRYIVMASARSNDTSSTEEQDGTINTLDLSVSEVVGIMDVVSTKRLVAAAKNQIYYEGI